MNDPIPDGVNRLLLVEGPDDREFFKRLASALYGQGNFNLDSVPVKISEYGGKSRLSVHLYRLFQNHNFRELDRIWIVRDVDYNLSESEREVGAPTRALQSVNSAIALAYERSSRKSDPPILPGYLLPTEGQPSFSLLAMPSSKHEAEGSLETLLLAAINRDPLLPCVDKYFKCVESAHFCSDIARNRLDKNRLRVLVFGKAIDRTTAASDEANSELPRFMYSMRWWDNRIFEDPLFNDAKDFLHQLLKP